MSTYSYHCKRCDKRCVRPIRRGRRCEYCSGACRSISSYYRKRGIAGAPARPVSRDTVVRRLRSIAHDAYAAMSKADRNGRAVEAAAMLEAHYHIRLAVDARLQTIRAKRRGRA